MAKKKEKKTPDEGFGLQKPQEPKSVQSTVTTEPPAPAPPPPPRPQPQQAQSAFPPLEVSALGTIARGMFRERLGFRKSPRAYDGSVVMLVKEEPQYLDLRSRPRSPLV